MRLAASAGALLALRVIAAAAPASSADVTALAVGGRHTCALHADGTVSCWGANQAGQLGDGTTTPSAVPVRVATITDAVELTASADRTCVRRRGGAIACVGQVTPTAAKATTPIELAIPDVVQLAGACWRQASGTAGCLTDGGQLQPLAGVTDAIDIAESDGIGCVARTSGKVACWFDPNDVRVVPLTGVVDVAVANGFACARTKAGATSCWDWRFLEPRISMRVPANPPPAKPPRQMPVRPRAVGVTALQLAGGGSTMCAATARDVRCWDVSRRVATVAVKATALAVREHRCALRGGRDVVCWGAGSEGALGFGWARGHATPVAVPGIADAVEVSASYTPGTGAQYACARRKTGTVVCWGNVSPHNSNVVDPKPREVLKLRAVKLARGMVAGAIDDKARWSTALAGGGMSMRLPPIVDADDDCAIGKDGRVLCMGEHRWNNDNFNNPNHPDGDGVAVPGLTDAVRLAISNNFACALRKTGQIACFRERDKLAVDAKIADAIDLATGQFTLCALRKDHTVWCKGQLGSWILRGDPLKTTGNTDWVQIPNLTDVAAISLGGDYACARKLDGTVACWGDNDAGQLGDGTTISRIKPAPVVGLAKVVQVSAGTNHACALVESGAVMCWGEATTGQIGSYAMEDVLEPTAVTW